MFEWLVSQQLLAAGELAPHSAEVWTAAADVALQVLAKTGDDGQEFHPNKVLNMFSVACKNAASSETFQALMAKPLKTLKTLGPESREDLMRQLNHMLKGNCGRGEMGRGETAMPVHRFSLQNPSPYNSKCSADQTMRGDGPCLPQLQLTHHELWPTRIATSRIEIPGMPDFHKRLSEMAIKKYTEFTKMAQRNGRQRLEDINNAFFSAQDKSERPGQRGMQFWPELYNSKEYKLLLKVLKNAAVDQAMKIGKYRTDRDKLMRESSMVLWAAVYTTHTPHLTHVHESSALSGTYYSNAPYGVSPIVFMDPRGGQPMHIDAIFPETEPEAPFHHQTTFFPNAGDLVLFPSWLPHRVPPNPSAESNTNPRVTWAFNLEVGSNGWIGSTHQ